MEIYIDFGNTFHLSVYLALRIALCLPAPLAMTRGLARTKGNLNSGGECGSIFGGYLDGWCMWGTSNSVIHVYDTDK
jgi:hypothetical protein